MHRNGWWDGDDPVASNYPLANPAGYVITPNPRMETLFMSAHRAPATTRQRTTTVIATVLAVLAILAVGLFFVGRAIAGEQYALDVTSEAYNVGVNSGSKMGSDPKTPTVNEDEAYEICGKAAAKGTTYVEADAFNATEGCVRGWLAAQMAYGEGSQ